MPDNNGIGLVAVLAMGIAMPMAAQTGDTVTADPLVVSAACDRSADDPRGCAARAVAADIATRHHLGVELKWSSNRSAFESVDGTEFAIPALVQYQEYATRVVAVALIERRFVEILEAPPAAAPLPVVDSAPATVWVAERIAAEEWGYTLPGAQRPVGGSLRSTGHTPSEDVPRYTIAGPETLRLVVARRRPVTASFRAVLLDTTAAFRADTAVSAGRCFSRQRGLVVASSRIDETGSLVCELWLNETYAAKAPLSMTARMKVSGKLIDRTVRVTPVTAPTYAVVGERGCVPLARRAMALLVQQGVPTAAPKRASRRIVLTKCARFDQILPTQSGDVPENGVLVEGRAEEPTAQSPLGSGDLERVGMFQLTATPLAGTNPWERAAESVVAKLLRYQPL